MAIEASDKPNLPKNVVDDEDDDLPLTFKRIAKKSPLYSEVKKTSSQSHEGQLKRQITDGPSSNGQNSKPSPMKPSAGISKTPNSVAVKTSSNKSPVANSKSKPLLGQKTSIDVKKETKVIENTTKGKCEDSEDDDDDKPLSSRWTIKSNHDNKVVAPAVKKSSEDSDDDDDVPLSAKLLRNCNSGTSSKNCDDSDKKPISKVQKDRQNGSSTSNKQTKPSTLPVKRDLENSDSMNSSVKKSKVSDSAASIKTKQVTVKPSEIKTQEEDDDDDRPISSHRFKKSADKPSTTKKIVTKVTKVNKSGSTSFKKQTKNKKTNSKQTKNKSKKSGSGSEYSKSTKLLPSSGDGQKKWTTLVHNGVIFPPPYQPHGVKMLYKGKPVDLTPEQEEVGFNI
jgi:DNA topoisomerase-1